MSWNVIGVLKVHITFYELSYFNGCSIDFTSQLAFESSLSFTSHRQVMEWNSFPFEPHRDVKSNLIHFAIWFNIWAAETFRYIREILWDAWNINCQERPQDWSHNWHERILYHFFNAIFGNLWQLLWHYCTFHFAWRRKKAIYMIRNGNKTKFLCQNAYDYCLYIMRFEREILWIFNSAIMSRLFVLFSVILLLRQHLKCQLENKVKTSVAIYQYL